LFFGYLCSGPFVLARRQPLPEWRQHQGQLGWHCEAPYAFQIICLVHSEPCLKSRAHISRNIQSVTNQESILSSICFLVPRPMQILYRQNFSSQSIYFPSFSTAAHSA